MSHDERSLARRIFCTAHRLLLEREMRAPLSALEGKILVLGAGYERYTEMLTSASYVCVTDIDDTNPTIDHIVDAHAIDFPESSWDGVVAMEVFEHLANPAKAASEIYRVLKPGGVAIISIPFMFRIHGDPFDFQRFTYLGIKELFKLFKIKKLSNYGNRLHVISDIITTSSPILIPLRILNHIIASKLVSMSKSNDCPSGYILQIEKPI